MVAELSLWKPSQIMKKTHKLFILLLVGLVSSISCQAQDLENGVNSFNKITVSPGVNLILKKGDHESVKVIYNDIPKSKVNVVVNGNKLKIYLDDARVVEKQVRIFNKGNTQKQGIYHGASITAYVTYKELKGVEIRGEQEFRCDDEIKTKKFKLKAYGETEIRLAALDTKKFKVSLYGKNDVRIKAGVADDQVYRLFGDNKINTIGLKSATATTRIYGEGKVSIYASEEVRINSFGEPMINIEGTSIISKGIILGRADIRVNR